MTVALLLALAATLGVAIALGLRLRSARRELTAATAREAALRDELQELGTSSSATIAALEQERDGLAATVDSTAADLADAEQARDELAADTTARIEALEQEREAAATDAAERIAALEAERDRAAAAAAAAAAFSQRAQDDGAGGAGPSPWPLLLARIERQWADAVAAGPDERGVVEGDPAQQFQQALARELQRLREEVGVDATFVGTLPDLAPADATPLLLAVTEAAAALAADAEAVQVELGPSVAVVGDGARVVLR